MLDKIKAFFRNTLDSQHYLNSTPFQEVFLEKNNYLMIYDVSYSTLYELKFLLIHLLESFEKKQKIQRQLIKKEKSNVYLIDFLFNKIDGVSDYTHDILRVKNDAIELEFLLDHVLRNDLNYGIIGANYQIASSTLPDIYNIIDQLDLASERMYS